jgi:hypothetical protein
MGAGAKLGSKIGPKVLGKLPVVGKFAKGLGAIGGALGAGKLLGQVPDQIEAERQHPFLALGGAGLSMLPFGFGKPTALAEDATAMDKAAQGAAETQAETSKLFPGLKSNPNAMASTQRGFDWSPSVSAPQPQRPNFGNLGNQLVAPEEQMQMGSGMVPPERQLTEGDTALQRLIQLYMNQAEP